MSTRTSLTHGWKMAGVIFLICLIGSGCGSRMKRQEKDLSLLLTGHRIGRMIVLGVVDVPEKGKQPLVNTRLSDLAVSHFVGLDEFRFNIVVKRQDEIEQITKKLGINLWEITDREKAKAVGEILGVDALILGKHHVSKQQTGGARVIFQVVDVGTGQLIWSETTTLME